MLDRYKDIVPDWDAFTEHCAKALPLCFWRNSLRIDKSDLEAWTYRHGLELESAAWNPDLFTIKSGLGEDRLGSSLLYLSGLIHIQEAVSLLPVVVAQISPENTVLDLCGAPGGKSLYAAQYMQNRGLIVCNDVNGYRLKAVRGSLDRLGISNTALSCLNGINYPRSENRFDRIFVDAPCSCEGTIRKNSEVLSKVSEKSTERISKTQEHLLTRALQLVEPGGLVIYSTCTFAPEENERVISNTLSSSRFEIEILPIHIDHLQYSSGIPSWCGQDFVDGIENCMRVWPQQNDTGGFFVSLLRKKASYS